MMVRRRLRETYAHSVWLAAAGVILLSQPSFGQDIYWAELKAMCNGSVVHHSTVGSMSTDDPVVSAELASKILLDPGERQLYWSEGQKVRRANLDSAGTADVVSVTGSFKLAGFALDLINRKIYWFEGVTILPCADPNCPRIRRADLDGSNLETLFEPPGGFVNASDIAVDAAAAKVYWSDRQYSPFISRANFDGSEVEPLVTTSIGMTSGVYNFVIDPAAGQMYWVDTSSSVPGDSRIRRGNLDGTSPEDFISYINTRPRPAYLSLDSACGWLYWTFSGFCPDDTGDILRINLTTKAQEMLFTGIGITRGIAVDAGADRDGDGTPDCNDGCPDDPAKTSPGVCGCGVADADTNNDGVVDCPAGMNPACCAPGTAATMLTFVPLLFIVWKRRNRH